MYYILILTFSGSLLFMGYFCWKVLCGQRVSQSMRYKVLWLVLLVYLIPWVWLKKAYKHLWYLLFRNSYGARTLNDEVTVKLADISTASEAYQTKSYRILLVVTGIWITVAVMMMLRKVARYFRERKKLLAMPVNHGSENLEEIVHALRKEFHIRQEVEVYEASGLTVSFTIGVIRPMIFLQSEQAERDKQLILRHEMVHVARRDNLAKFIVEWICCMHWFNILIYLFKEEFNMICENACDEKVVRKFNKEERVEYANLLVRNVKEQEERMTCNSTMSIPQKYVEERIRIVMETKKVKAWKKMMAAGAFAVLLFVNSLTALAYPNVFHVDNTTVEIAGDVTDGDNSWVFNEAVSGNGGFIEEIIYDEQFIDEEGRIYPGGSQGQRLTCNHNIVSGYFQTHVKDDNGGCTVKRYESTRCMKCDTIWVGDLVSTTIYVKCPH